MFEENMRAVLTVIKRVKCVLSEANQNMQYIDLTDTQPIVTTTHVDTLTYNTFENTYKMIPPL